MTSSLQFGEKALAEITSVLDVISEPAIALTTDYHIIAANRAYRKTYGDDHPLLQRYCYEVSHAYTAPCDQMGESCPLKACLESGQSQRVLHLHQTPRGEEHVDVKTFPVRDERGEISYLVEIMQTTRDASSRADAQKMVGRSAVFNDMLAMINRVAPATTTALLLGESGTGKEMVARAIHDNSRVSQRPFVIVECSGLSETLFESELFGHERGAFTGASNRKKGLVELVDGGTLFLDEVGDIPLAMQVKLLRLLETGTFRRVGGTEVMRADFRLIAATHRNLTHMVEQEEFRRDLFYRINVFPITLPPLRQRPEDIPLLAQSLLTRLSADQAYTLSDKALACLQAYAFPGNIRELRNLLERAILMSDDFLIDIDHLPPEVCNHALGETVAVNQEEILSLDQVEKMYLRRLLQRFGGDREQLAQKLGVSKRTLYRKLSGLAAENDK